MRKIFYIALCFTLVASAAFGQADFSKVRINDYSGGMVTNALSDILSLNQMTMASNAIINKRGIISKRKGQSLFASDTNSTPFTGLSRFDPDPATSYMVAASGASIIYAINSASSWTTVNSASPFSITSSTEFIQANDLLFVMNGRDYTAWWDGQQFIQGNGWGNASPPTAVTAAWVANYMFMAGNPGAEDTIYISTNLEPTVFEADELLRINTGDGQIIKRLEPFRQNEIIVYKQRSIFLLDITGRPPSVCTTDCWTTQAINNGLGTIAPRSVVNLGNDQWFLSSEPIRLRSLARTSLDKILIDSVSTPIDDIFDGTGDVQVNRSQVSKAAAILFDNKYFLAIPTDDSTVNNYVEVYDFITKGWSVITGWFPSDWIIFDNRLFYTDANIGRVIEVFTANYADFAASQVSITRQTNPGAPISFQYISKNLDFDNPENFKVPDALELEFAPTGDYTATVYINLDDSGWLEVGTVNLEGETITLPATLPFSSNESGIVRKTFQLQKYGEFKKMRIRVDQNGLNQQVRLQRASLIGRVRPWRRE